MHTYQALHKVKLVCYTFSTLKSVKSQSSTPLLYVERHLMVLIVGTKGWEAQEAQKFVVFDAALAFLMPIDKMLIEILLLRYCFQQYKLNIFVVA